MAGYPGAGSGSRPTSRSLALVVALASAWSQPPVRTWPGLASHAIMRIWSVLEFIPKALTFEHAEPESIAEETAAMDQAQLWRLSLDVVTSGAMLAAFTAAARTV